MCEPPLGKSGKLKKVEAMPKDPPAAGSRHVEILVGIVSACCGEYQQGLSIGNMQKTEYSNNLLICFFPYYYVLS